MGNTFLHRAGKDESLPPVAMGSHLDSVIQAGAFDGVVGVVGALEALYMLADEELTASIEIVIFKAEESSRFGYATMGSKLMTGSATVEQLTGAQKKGDCTFPEALRAAGYDPELAAEAIKEPGCYKAFLELHIEQGKVLYETGEQIGIVHNIAAPTRFKVITEGMADHSGATPMEFRRDALTAAAKVILAVQEAARAEARHGTVATVGVIEAEPGSINVIPGKVTLWVDLRGVKTDSVERTLKAIKEATAQVCIDDEIKVGMQMMTQDKPVALSEKLAERLGEICEEKGLRYRHMNSGAGHDTMHVAKLCPASMIFVPCKDGISHNPQEYAKIEDICAGIDVLAAMIKKLAM